MRNICDTLLKCKDVLLSSIKYNYKCNIFGTIYFFNMSHSDLIGAFLSFLDASINY